MVKKIMAATIGAVMIATSVSAAEFTDIGGHWAEESIRTLSDKGVVNGVTDTQYMPDGEVTRAEYLKMIMETTGLKPVTTVNGSCLDATAEDWFAPYLKRALMCGLVPDAMVAGYKENVSYTLDEAGNAISTNVSYSGAFNGNLPITREEMAVLTQYVYQYTRTILTNEVVKTDKLKPFADDEKISSWAAVPVKQAVANGFMEGMDDNMFNPTHTATRAQAATIILRVLNKIGG